MVNQMFDGLSSELKTRIEKIHEISASCQDPADTVQKIAVHMQELLKNSKSFITEEHTKSSDEHYARNLIYKEDDDSLSLYCLVWQPGQWTPIHDHGAWGLVGVIEGIFEEQNFARVDTRSSDDSGIELKKAGVSLLVPGSVTTFVPNPDHIHRAGVSENSKQAITLHLYGRNMNRYNVYDLESGTRERVDVSIENGKD